MVSQQCRGLGPKAREAHGAFALFVPAALSPRITKKENVGLLGRAKHWTGYGTY